MTHASCDGTKAQPSTTWTAWRLAASPHSTFNWSRSIRFPSLFSLTSVPRSQPPAGFVAIGPGIYMSIPPANGVPLETNDAAPTVILIFGWMGALTRHLERYSRKYSELYPHATQIIVKCDPSFFWTSAQGKRKRLLPVVQALESLGCMPSINPTRVRPRVLVHSFSNGGGYQLMTLSHLLSSQYPPSDTLVSALILDSSPTIATFRTIGKAFTIAIRNPVVRYVALPLLYAIHTVRLVFETVFGWETMPTRYLRTLLRPRLLPWMSTETHRLYVFSKRDELVPWRDVQAHAEAAKAVGLDVRCELYEESAHVSHMRLDPGRYWGSVQDLWQMTPVMYNVKSPNSQDIRMLRRVRHASSLYTHRPSITASRPDRRFPIFPYNLLNILFVSGNIPSGGWQLILCLILEYVPVHTLSPRFILSMRELYARDAQAKQEGGIDSASGLSSSGRIATGSTIVFADIEQNEGLAAGIEEIPMDMISEGWTSQPS